MWGVKEHFRLGPGLSLIRQVRDDEAIWAAGHSYFTTPAHLTFADAVIAHLFGFVGAEWLRQQRSLPPKEIHPVAKWWVTLELELAQNKIQAADNEPTFTATPSGDVRSLVCLARDIFCLCAMDSFPAERVARLIDPMTFQATRYELAVASVFARCGHEIRWIPDKKARSKHPEFLAIPWVSGKLECSGIFCVEAKSRHRTGILGYQDGGKGVSSEANYIKNRTLDACEQANGEPYKNMPLIVCIDMNEQLQGSSEPEQIKWINEGVFKYFDQLGHASPDEVFPYSALCFTNFAFYYAGNQVTKSGNSERLIHLAPQSTRRLISPDLIKPMSESLDSYGMMPIPQTLH